jgi:hypothetical protein
MGLGSPSSSVDAATHNYAGDEDGFGCTIRCPGTCGAPRNRVERRAAVDVEHDGLNGSIGLATLVMIARLDAGRSARARSHGFVVGMS